MRAGKALGGPTMMRGFGSIAPSGRGVVLPAFDQAARSGRTLFPSRVYAPEEVARVLKSGHQSRKIGAFATKGPRRGWPIFTLTLEERATCPRSCQQWRSCYGNNMQATERIEPGEALENALVAELAELQAKHPDGFMVRAHVLGDFYSEKAQRKSGGSQLNFDQAVGRLREQVSAITRPGQNWRARELTLSTNFELRVDGRPRRDRSRPADQAVAFYFELDDEPLLLACDRFDRIEDNIAAIAAHIDALRGQERWGVADLKQAFAGHVALPAPEKWWQVLGVSQHASAEEVDRAWRDKMQAAHPDRAGGSEAAAQRLNWARAEAKKR